MSEVLLFSYDSIMTFPYKDIPKYFMLHKFLINLQRNTIDGKCLIFYLSIHFRQNLPYITRQWDAETIPYHQARKQSKLYRARIYEVVVYLAITRLHAMGAVAVTGHCKIIGAGLMTARPSLMD